MKYELIGKIDGFDNDKYYTRIRWLRVGIVCSTFVALMSLVTKNFIELAMVVPLITFIRTLESQKNKLSFINCSIITRNDNGDKSIKAINCVAIDDEVCSYLVKICEKRIHLKYSRKKGCIEFTGKMKECYVNNTEVPVTSERIIKRFRIYTDKENAEMIGDLLKINMPRS